VLGHQVARERPLDACADLREVPDVDEDVGGQMI
jgi:hypothetical protein